MTRARALVTSPKAVSATPSSSEAAWAPLPMEPAREKTEATWVARPAAAGLSPGWTTRTPVEAGPMAASSLDFAAPPSRTALP